MSLMFFWSFEESSGPRVDITGHNRWMPIDSASSDTFPMSDAQTAGDRDGDATSVAPRGGERYAC